MKQYQISVEYNAIEDLDEKIDRAFDILFEETLRQMDLTSNDN
jgi:hypothetical protein